MEELREARVVADSGLEGCAHAQPGGKRQVLLVDRETLEAMELRPGILWENITTDGLNVNSLPIGQQLRVGHQQAIVDPVAGTFTAVFANTISSTSAFAINGTTFTLGQKGQAFRAPVTGHVNATPPPNGQFGGYAVGVGELKLEPGIHSGGPGVVEENPKPRQPVPIHFSIDDGSLQDAFNLIARIDGRTIWVYAERECIGHRTCVVDFAKY